MLIESSRRATGIKPCCFSFLFKGKEDETQYRVTCCQKDLRTINEPIEQIEDVQVYVYEDIGSARGVFQNAVNYCM